LQHYTILRKKIKERKKEIIIRIRIKKKKRKERKKEKKKKKKEKEKEKERKETFSQNLQTQSNNDYRVFYFARECWRRAGSELS